MTTLDHKRHPNNMTIFRKIKTFLHNPWTLGQKLMEWTWWLWSDAAYLRLCYFFYVKKPLHLKDPQTFNEKLQWLKIYDRNPLYTSLVDKYKVKGKIGKIIGSEYLIPTLGVWENVDEIDWNSLPNSFVLKTTHGGGGSGVVICKDKTSLNVDSAKTILKRSMRIDIYNTLREWPYKNVTKRIIAEEYIEDSNGDLPDYKFFCFNGFVHSVMLCLDRSKGDTKFYFFDKEWKLLRLNIRGKNAPEGFTLPKPPNMEKMFELAGELSRGIPFVRVDLYNVEGKIYFGEMTFYPDSGFDGNLLPETDKLFGELINIGNS